MKIIAIFTLILTCSFAHGGTESAIPVADRIPRPAEMRADIVVEGTSSTRQIIDVVCVGTIRFTLLSGTNTLALLGEENVRVPAMQPLHLDRTFRIPDPDGPLTIRVTAPIRLRNEHVLFSRELEILSRSSVDVVETPQSQTD